MEPGGDADVYDFRSNDGPTVLLEVSDDGVAMSAKTRHSESGLPCE